MLYVSHGNILVCLNSQPNQVLMCPSWHSCSVGPFARLRSGKSNFNRDNGCRRWWMVVFCVEKCASFFARGLQDWEGVFERKHDEIESMFVLARVTIICELKKFRKCSPTVETLIFLLAIWIIIAPRNPSPTCLPYPCHYSFWVNFIFYEYKIIIVLILIALDT